jgi:hypothetical protein
MPVRPVLTLFWEVPGAGIGEDNNFASAPSEGERVRAWLLLDGDFWFRGIMALDVSEALLRGKHVPGSE